MGPNEAANKGRCYVPVNKMGDACGSAEVVGAWKGRPDWKACQQHVDLRPGDFESLKPNSPRDIIREAAELMVRATAGMTYAGPEARAMAHHLRTLLDGVWLEREMAEAAHDALRYWEQKTELYEDGRLEQAAAAIRRQLDEEPRK